MKLLKKGFGIADQSATEVKKPHKHDANLQKNSSLYFQVGLILCLLVTFFLFEMRFETQQNEFSLNQETQDELIEVFHDYQIEVPKEKPVEVDRSNEVVDEIEEVSDDHKDIIETFIQPNEPSIDEPIKPSDIVDPIDTDIPDDIPFVAVQYVPVFPGCEKFTNNEDRRNCMSEKITRIVQKRFDTDIAIEYGLTGIQKIDVQFIVDKNGEVTGIKTRAPHPKLEEEAERVINKIPQMKPGMQQDKPVNVIYTLPIKFQVRD